MMKGNRAFTLIELLVVIAIIAILAAILFPVFAQAKAAAKKTQSLSNMKNVATAHLMYSSDYDDKYSALQIYVQHPTTGDPCGMQIKWQDAIYPYVKNGKGIVAAGNNSGGYQEGVFRSPGGKAQDGSSYAMHQDVFMDNPTVPWTGCNPMADPTYAADYRTFSQTQIDDLAGKVMMIERGDSNGRWAFLQFSAWQWDWDTWGCRGNQTCDGDLNGDVSRTAGRDCDGGWTGPDATGSDTWAWCSMFPRYRYTNSTPFAFFDGHVKTMSRSAGTGSSASSQVDWLKNIFIPEAVRPSWSSWYPY